jgi:hypothetical protein
MTVCPVCKKQIYGRDIDINKIVKSKSKIDHWPLSYVHCHDNTNFPMHALMIYIDANFSVRGLEISNFVKIQK